ncbi:nitrogen regulation protein NR(II) [Motiliproteus sp. SC1-56]|uniref:two-component system sensor histidine kinase NtrB n=1 Tax=Motiliproteus sp. SC1-56 TaxID=2799565 RepID=UPI001A8F6356|nr:ATP-binding protein [Motiliproteus sp. SC1-56]
MSAAVALKRSLLELRSHFRANPLSWLVAVLLLLLVGMVSFFIYHMDVEMRRNMLHHDQRQHLQLRRLLLEQQVAQSVADLRLLSERAPNASPRALESRLQLMCDNQPHYARFGVYYPDSGTAIERACAEPAVQGEVGVDARAEGGVLFAAAGGRGVRQLAVRLINPGSLEGAQVQVFWPGLASQGRVAPVWGLSFSLASLSAEAGIARHAVERMFVVAGAVDWQRAVVPALAAGATAPSWERLSQNAQLEADIGLLLTEPVALRDPVSLGLIAEWKMIALTPAERLQADYGRFARHMAYLAGVFLLLLAALYFYSRGVIGKQLQMLTDLKRKQAFLDSLLDSSSDAMLTLDLDGLILSCNARAENLFGFRPSELKGRTVEDLLPSDYQITDQDYGEVFARLEKSGVEYERRELVGVRRNGEDFPVEVTYCRLKMQVQSRLLLTIREITERKVAERELDSLRMQYFQQEKMAQIGLLVAGILHEVGNPLAAIRGLLEQVLDDDRDREQPQLDASARASLEMVLEQTDRIRTISHEISGFASPHQNERGPLSLNAILEGAARLLSYDKRWREIQLDLDLDPSLPAMEGIADQLTQVFMNLLVNASDAFEPGMGARPRVEIRTRHLAEGVILVSVSDNGMGIDEETMTHIFDAFYTTKPKGKGTGLGLSICEKLIAEHRGAMEMESQRGVGTEVRIFFEYEPLSFS